MNDQIVQTFLQSDFLTVNMSLLELRLPHDPPIGSLVMFLRTALPLSDILHSIVVILAN